MELPVLFWKLLLGGENVEKWSDHQEKKFFTDNAVQVLIPFQGGHRGLLKLYVHLGEGIRIDSESIGILFAFWSSKKWVGEF